MQTTLNESVTHKLTLEKISGQWWLELIDRATGQTRIIRFGRKDKAAAFFDRMPMAEIMRVYDKLNVPTVAMYKAGVM